MLYKVLFYGLTMKYFHISYILLITSVIIFNTYEENIEDNKKSDNFICNRTDESIPCDNDKKSICYNVICGLEDFPFQNDSVQFLTICNWPHKSFDLNIIEFRNLSLHEVKNEQFHNIIHNSIQKFDLRGNHLEIIDKKFIDSFHKLEHIYLSGNSYLCSEKMLDDYEWLLNNSKKIQDLQQISCGTNTSNAYYGKPILPILQFIKAAQNECPTKCSCKVTYVMQHPETGLTPFVAVNCTNIGLKDLPTNLPINTTILHLEKNEITNLTALTENKIYMNISDLYLDDNSISTIDVLEGTDWLNKFRILSLRGNQLHFVKTYILENAFEKNIYISRLHLGNNPWICECHFIPVFQELLRKYSTVITDQDMTCMLEEKRKIIYKPILSLSRIDLCKIPNTFKLEPLDILNIVLASLIVIILGKLAYDYYSFKNSGKLPWIVLKMP
ncbi:protein singed wings 2 [Chrysoperla carnea]|uniref:protein singed wings 2 n=1 Tax=Chrysoperla carnea TaxID=189513 RepID=UPI001D082BB1|nr:protein singed wings 2 [Chrysoperla carnea]